MLNSQLNVVGLSEVRWPVNSVGKLFNVSHLRCEYVCNC